MARTIKFIEKAAKTMEGAGFPVFRPQRLPDPFLLLDEFGPINYGPGEAKGAPNHPHRGFITVSYLLAGEMRHKDSMGNTGLLKPGDVQFMTAGSGVIHDERPSKELLNKGGLMHGFQIWINLPARLKMIDPDYQDVPKRKIPEVKLPNDEGTAKVVAGEAFGVVGPVKTHTPIHYIDFSLPPSSFVSHSLPQELNTMVYIIEGEGYFGEELKRAGEHQMVVFNNNSEKIQFQTRDSPARFLLLAGAPINEPIARYGPFVMNTQKELITAFQEYQEGTFVKAKGKMLDVETPKRDQSDDNDEGDNNNNTAQ